MPAPRPPSADPLVALADRCVQCGLCLPACPTYRHDRIEAESPRGRIALSRALALATVPPTPAGDAHLDQCLACRGCEAVCPAGVDFDALLLETRARQRRRRGAGRRQRSVEWLVARKKLLRIALRTYAAGWAALPKALRPLPRPPARHAAVAPPAERRPRTAALFVGCVADVYEAPVRDALARLLAATGVAMTEPRDQVCCGTLHAHAGGLETARRLASTNAGAFAGADRILTLASGCHGAVAEATGGDGRVVDALDFLATRLGDLQFRPTPRRVAVHLPCTQRSVSRSVPALRRLLAAVAELDVVELTAGYGCCGAAGTQMLVDPDRADGFRAPLVDQLHASGASLVLSANIGCRLHLAGGTAVRVMHPVEFLAERLAPRDAHTPSLDSRP